MKVPRIAVLALLAALLLVADAQLALTLAPALLVAALPLTGAFLGETLIVARRTQRSRVPRPARTRWIARARTAPVSLLERSPRSLRGPPVAA